VVDAPGDVLDRMREQMVRVGPATLARYAEVVHAGLGEMRGATAPRLLLEVVCARLLMPSASDTEAALLQRVERIETRLDISIPAGEAAVSAAPPLADKQYTRKTPALTPQTATPDAPPARPISAPSPTPEPEPEPEPGLQIEPESEPPPQPPLPASEPPAPEPEPATAPAAASATSATSAGGPAEPSAADVRKVWSTVRDKVRERSRTTEVMLSGAIVRVVQDGTLILAHESAPLAKRLSEQRNADVIRDALKDLLGVDWRVRCELGVGMPAAEADAVAPEPESDPVDERRAEEDGMIAEVGRDDAAPRRDPEEAALELLQTELGARRIDG